ncbi:type II toxin-antitoxin system VapC family toxin [Hoeflea poritis]|uniref:Type II toxin-antitoxin system VapC family toxin n=1 Tax=Hoeflea poritis TaxID=2993659 RepID=A0ABT4VMV7_9HYPH|nr:type II toxin-antitoxin system VapC family toxin [Hoeflea poritis]MDA4845505.1 type II toxin-antitoxin system VapC family toxin [Hoeflea poritis]
MTSYLLDTNILSDLIRNPQGSVLRHIEAVGEEAIATNIIVAAELRFGAAKKGSAALKERVDTILSRLNILPLEEGFDEVYGELRADLEMRGTPIGANDLLIAAHVRHLCVERDWVLVTANQKEFGRVDSLVLENWLK